MKTNLRKQAEELSALPYTIRVDLTETTDGEAIYVASVFELEGCLGQGRTPEEAMDNLHEAQIDYIQSLLEDGLPVPSPEFAVTTTSSQGKTFIWGKDQALDTIKRTTKILQPAY